jgi:siroheme synthase
MTVDNLPHVVAQLIRYGRAPETPVALIRWGTWPAQETITSTLADIVAVAAQRQFGPPAVAVVGEVVRFAEIIGTGNLRRYPMAAD